MSELLRAVLHDSFAQFDAFIARREELHFLKLDPLTVCDAQRAH